MMTDQSARLFTLAKALIPGGVNSPVRACRSVGCDPLFVRRAAGCLITDVDGNEFIDFVGSWGPMILGHAHPEVVEAIQRTAADGTSFGAPSRWRWNSPTWSVVLCPRWTRCGSSVPEPRPP